MEVLELDRLGAVRMIFGLHLFRAVRAGRGPDRTAHGTSRYASRYTGRSTSAVPARAARTARTARTACASRAVPGAARAIRIGVEELRLRPNRALTLAIGPTCVAFIQCELELRRFQVAFFPREVQRQAKPRRDLVHFVSLFKFTSGAFGNEEMKPIQ
jgi:hypothetical protein